MKIYQVKRTTRVSKIAGIHLSFNFTKKKPTDSFLTSEINLVDHRTLVFLEESSALGPSYRPAFNF